MSHAFIYDAVRTRFGRFGGSLASHRPDDLSALVLQALVDRNPGMQANAVDDIFWGSANQAGEDNRNVGRMAALLAGMPTSTPATTINRLCGSSLDAVMQGSRAIETGDAEIVIAGGGESMTRAPFVMPKPARAYTTTDMTLSSTTLGWRLTNPKMPPEWTVSLGECNEQIGDRYSISRARQDRYALRSHRLASDAWAAGFYDKHIVAVPGVASVPDDSIRADATTDALASLRPVFRPNGTITAGNASPLSDGAAALVMGSETASLGNPLARVAGRGTFALTPQDFGLAPIEAASRAVLRAGISWAQLGAVEVNEAFAVQTLACTDAWGVDPDIVNTKGGAIAIGHPLGASGARIVTTLVHRLKESNERWGLAAICIGVGQGLAVVLENAT